MRLRFDAKKGFIMTNKITKRDNFVALLNIPAVAENAELVNFINHEIDLLDRKNKSRSGELTETQKENLALGEKMMDFITEADRELTVKDFRVHFGITAQKATPILNKLVEEHKLSKRVDKRISYFALVK